MMILFNKKNLDEITQDEMKHNIGALNLIFNKVSELNRKNNLLKAKYESDAKYCRIHKRIVEQGGISNRESELFEALQGIKTKADDKVLQNSKLLNNESYFNSLMMQLTLNQFVNVNKIKLDDSSSDFINHLVVREYMNEYQGKSQW